MLNIRNVLRTTPTVRGLLRTVTCMASAEPVEVPRGASFENAAYDVALGLYRAGKTTLFCLIPTVLQSNARSVRVDGFDVLVTTHKDFSSGDVLSGFALSDTSINQFGETVRVPAQTSLRVAEVD